MTGETDNFNHDEFIAERRNAILKILKDARGNVLLDDVAKATPMCSMTDFQAILHDLVEKGKIEIIEISKSMVGYGETYNVKEVFACLHYKEPSWCGFTQAM